VIDKRYWPLRGLIGQSTCVGGAGIHMAGNA
jgi:hypothetical protein